MARKNILQTARDAGNFSKLIKAIEQAGLRNTFEGEGPYTVFAPTDSAFSKLPSDQFDELMKRGQKSKLKNLLRYHVVPKKVASDAISNTKIETLGGDMVRTKVSGNTVRFGDARVTKPDIQCSNGIIHAIDRVIMPEDV
jgi:uncharacterized surface protein with fasciclin (FAS1) repeats